MRRKDKEISDRNSIDRIIAKAQVCRLALCKDDTPYIVPVSFGYDQKALYFHTTIEKGLKDEYIEADNTVCFELEHGVKVLENDKSPCGWSFSFQSVIGFGRIIECTANEEKQRALHCIMSQYSAQQWDFSGIPLTRVRVWKIEIESVTGKQSLDYAREQQ